MDNIAPPFDQTKYYLGKPCPGEHLYGDTGKTLKLHMGRDCPECKTLRNRRWEQRNGPRDRTSRKNRELLHAFGITLAEYESMLKSQDGVCAICHRKPHTYYLVVDHSHDTGKVRGLLCSGCNKALGFFGDDPDRLRQALIYLG